MKKLLLSLFVAFSIAACSNNKTEHDHGDGTHSHEGTEHQHTDTLKTNQEEFTVDSASHEHDHHEGSDHKH
jgi:hypothetical protein